MTKPSKTRPSIAVSAMQEVDYSNEEPDNRRQPLLDIGNTRRTRSMVMQQSTHHLAKPSRRRSERLSAYHEDAEKSLLRKPSDDCKANSQKQPTCRAMRRSRHSLETSGRNGNDDKTKKLELGEILKLNNSLKNENDKRLRSSSSLDPSGSIVGVIGRRTSKRTRLFQSVAPNSSVLCGKGRYDGSNDLNETQSQANSSTDILEEAHHNLVLAPFDDSKYTAGISVYDTPSKGKILEAPEYVTDIFQRLYNAETQHLLHPYLHKQQPIINEIMRSILVDWLIEVHMKFRLEQETLYLCINILDRYLSRVRVERKQLQLVGVTALLIASKYEEIYPPEVKDCVYITDRAYTRQDILDMEATILAELQFNLTVPNAYPFLQRFLFIVNATSTMSIASRYYLDRMLQEHDVLQFRPSLLAAAVVCLAINHPEIREFDEVEGERPGMPKALLEYTGFLPASILEAAEFVTSKIDIQVQTLSKRKLVAVKRKYQESRYKFISSDFEAPSVSSII